MTRCPEPHELVEGGEAVARHLGGCANCRATLARLERVRATFEEVRRQPPPSLSASGEARIEAALRWAGVRPTATRAALAWRVAAVAAAASLVAVAGLAIHLARRGPAGAPPTVAVAPATPPRPAIVAPRSDNVTAVINLIGGDVRLRRDGQAQPATLATTLRAGDQLIAATASRVGLQWGEGSGALLSGEGDLTLARLERQAQRIVLRQGRVAARVGPHQPGETMNVATPDHVITVQGTWFIVAADARGTQVEVIEGVVEVSRPDGGESTRLAAPMRGFFPRGRALAESSRALSAQEAAGLRQASEMGLLAWTAVEDLLRHSGQVVVRTTPESTVAVDGVLFGESPLTLRRPAGRHLVELARHGYTTMSRWVTVGQAPAELREALLPRPTSSASVDPEPDEVRGVARARQRQVSACYEKALKRDARLAGTVSLAIRVGDAGQVLGSAVDHDTLEEDEVLSCLRREVAGWSFARARNVTVVYPFVFRTP